MSRRISVSVSLTNSLTHSRQLVYEGKWYHIGVQSISPSHGNSAQFSVYEFKAGHDGTGGARAVKSDKFETCCFEWCLSDEIAFNGGSSLRIDGYHRNAPASACLLTSCLFNVYIPVKPERKIVGWISGYSNGGEKEEIGIYIRLVNAGKPIRMQTENNSNSPSALYRCTDNSNLVLLPTLPKILAAGMHRQMFELVFSDPVAVVTEVGVYVRLLSSDADRHTQRYQAYVGEIALSTNAVDLKPTSLYGASINSQSISDDGMLRWQWDNAYRLQSVDHFNIYLDNCWLGYAFSTSFQLSRRQRKAAIDRFRIVPVDLMGRQFIEIKYN